jgi:hypothetical protein
MEHWNWSGTYDENEPLDWVLIDPDLEVLEIGGFSPVWNGKEWLDSSSR